MTGVRYWVHATTGDPLPIIGTGFRLVTVTHTAKGYRLVGPLPELIDNITKQEWDELPHLLHDPAECWNKVLASLRAYGKLPCQNKETCNVKT